MQAIPLRAKGSFTLKPEHLASRFKDSMLPPVLASPIMILAMEPRSTPSANTLNPARAQSATAVDVRHLAATNDSERTDRPSRPMSQPSPRLAKSNPCFRLHQVAVLM